MLSLPLERQLLWRSSRRNSSLVNWPQLRVLRHWWLPCNWSRLTWKPLNLLLWVVLFISAVKTTFYLMLEKLLKLCILPLQTLVFNHKIQENAVLREIAMLGYGSMVFKLCAAHPNCPAEVMKVNGHAVWSYHQLLSFHYWSYWTSSPTYFPQPILDIAAEAIAKADVAEIILAVKVLGNAGHPASIKTIMKLLPGFGTAAAALPVRVHVDAVMALRNVAKFDRRRASTNQSNFRGYEGNFSIQVMPLVWNIHLFAFCRSKK